MFSFLRIGRLFGKPCMKMRHILGLVKKRKACLPAESCRCRVLFSSGAGGGFADEDDVLATAPAGMAAGRGGFAI